jgi:hypothetical protein
MKEQVPQRPIVKPLPAKQTDKPTSQPDSPLITMQNRLGNRAIQRLLAQRTGDSAFDLDDATAGRINRARGGGQALTGNDYKIA